MKKIIAIILVLATATSSTVFAAASGETAFVRDLDKVYTLRSKNGCTALMTHRWFDEGMAKKLLELKCELAAAQLLNSQHGTQTAAVLALTNQEDIIPKEMLQEYREYKESAGIFEEYSDY